VIDVAIIGDELKALFLAETVDQLHTLQLPDITAAVFDGSTDTWLLHTVAGESHVTGIVVDTRTLRQVPTPNMPGCNDFEGPLFHYAAWPADFEPADKRVAVIGDRTAHVVAALSGATVTVFDCPPTWQTRRTRRRWVPHLPERSGPLTVTSPVRWITRTGVDTSDGTHHGADVIIFASRCGAEAYLGIAAHGSPNYFTVLGPDSPMGDQTTIAERQGRYIADCLQLMRDKGGTRIEVRRSAQQQYVERGRITTPARAFEVDAGTERQVYDGPAQLTVGDAEYSVRVRLTGRVDPIDGKYHWQGTVFDTTAELASRPVRLTVDHCGVEARILETTPWGSYSIAGVGAPPYAAQT
jgi:cation diffusion facilitator CzcD-associated flavoprotein CzcO